MTSGTVKRFWRLFHRLPAHVQEQAKEVFRRWRDDPFDRGLEFKQLAGRPGLWSVRIGLNHRAVGTRTGNHVEWNWIGPHDGYDTRIR